MITFNLYRINLFFMYCINMSILCLMGWRETYPYFILPFFKTYQSFCNFKIMLTSLRIYWSILLYLLARCNRYWSIVLSISKILMLIYIVLSISKILILIYIVLSISKILMLIYIVLSISKILMLIYIVISIARYCYIYI